MAGLIACRLRERTMTSVDLITLSREYGAGAALLGKALGDHLGWRVLDDEIPRLVAERLGLERDTLVDRDEHAGSLLERAGRAVILGNPEVLLSPELVGQPDPPDVARATRQVLLDAAASPPLIVVGHGAQALFQHRPGTLRLRLVAPLATRVRLIQERRPADEGAAVRLANRIDADRQHFVREFFGADVRDPLLYHLTINTGLVSLAESVEMVARLVAARSGAVPTTGDATRDER
jgi:cytidylate kinase